MLNIMADLVANETWRSVFSRLAAEEVAPSKELLLNPRSFKCFNVDNLEKINTHLTAFVTQLEDFIDKENNTDITTLFSVPIAQTNRFLALLKHLKKVDLTKAESLAQKHFSTLDGATFIEIANEIQKALLPVEAEVKECFNLINGASFTSLNMTLEDAEIIMSLLTATKASKNVITYSGAMHSMNVNTTLQALGFNKVKHDGPTVIDSSKLMSYGLDEKTIESNNALFLDLLQRR